MMNRRTFLVAGGGTAAGLTLPGWANAIGTPRSDASINILRPSTHPDAVHVANALASTLFQAGQSSCQLDIDGRDMRSITHVLTTPDCARWLAILEPAGAVVVGELARSLGLGLRWYGQHAIAGGSARHHGSLAGLDGSLNWQTDSQGWGKQLAHLYSGILTNVAPKILTGAPLKATSQASVELACLLLTK